MESCVVITPRYLFKVNKSLLSVPITHNYEISLMLPTPPTSSDVGLQLMLPYMHCIWNTMHSIDQALLGPPLFISKGFLTFCQKFKLASSFIHSIQRLISLNVCCTLKQLYR